MKVDLFNGICHDQSMEQEAHSVIQQKLDAIYKSVEKTRKMFLTMIWMSVLAVVLPVIFLFIAVPIIINNTLGSFGGLL